MILRQFAGGQNPDAPRRLVRRKVAAAPAQQVLLFRRGTSLQLNGGHGDLALLLVRQAERDGASHGRVSQDRLFQFAHIHRVAARLDHLFCAAYEPDQSKPVALGQIPGTQPAVAGQKAPGFGPGLVVPLVLALVWPLVFPIVRSETASADLAFARDTCRHDLPVLINQADAKWRHREAQVAAAGQPRQLDTHHGEAAQLDHPVAVQQNGWDTPAPEQPEERSKPAQTQPDVGGKMVAGGEPDTYALEPRRGGIAVEKAGKHGGHADKGGHVEALDHCQCGFRIEAVEKAAADPCHEPI